MLRSEAGSILPIGIGLAILSIVLSLTYLEQLGIQIQTLTNKSVSDFLAQSVATNLETDKISPVIGLDYEPTHQRQLQAAANYLGITPTLVTVKSQDGTTIEATVCTRWRSITGITFGVLGEVCAQSKARAIT